MRKIIGVAAVALTATAVAGCNTPGERALGGAAIGAGAGAIIGGAATGRAGGALAGAAIGGASGAIIGAGTAPVARRQNCYYDRYYGQTVCDTY